MTDLMVFGERLDDLGADLQAMTTVPGRDGTTHVEFRLDDDGPLLRALRRAEVEVILSGNPRGRHAETRRYDAFLLVCHRITEAVAASAT